MKKLAAYFWNGPRIRLRALRLEDLEAWLLEMQDSEAVRTLSYGVELPKSPEAARKFAEEFGEFKNADRRIMFTIETHRGQIVGGTNIHSIDRKNGTFGTGTLIHRRYRGRGYAGEAKEILLRYAFHEMRLQKYNVACIETNVAEIRSLLKLGCRKEGRIRRAIYTGGQYHDELRFGMTREEFDTRYPREAKGATGSKGA
jgi:RimJ/RimL family protein N-acetyltransferase